MNEVTVTYEKTGWQKIKDSLKSNYTFYFVKEKFLVYRILRYTEENEPDKKDYTVEITDENNSFTSFYDSSFMLTTSENKGDFKFKKNVSSSKVLFKINYPYDAGYWGAHRTNYC